MRSDESEAIVVCWELFHEAVIELATRCATPRQRLLGVAERQILAVAELGDGLDDAELKAWIARLVRRLRGSFNEPTRLAVFTTVNGMSDEDVDAALMEIVVIYDEVTRIELIERMRAAA
jgi:hypothetical protein